MKICKQCGAEQADDVRFCHSCGADLGEEPTEAVSEEVAEEVTEEVAEEVSEEAVGEPTGEIPEESTAEVTEAASEEPAAEGTAEAPDEPAEAPAEKKKTPWGWIIGLAAAVVLVVVLILVKGQAGKAVSLDSALHTNAYGLESYSIHMEQGEEGAAFSYLNEEGKPVSVKDSAVEKLMDQVVATAGIVELTNRDLQYYYDQQYYYFMTASGNYAAYLIDGAKALDEQESVYEGSTWQNYFLTGAVDMFHQVAALYQLATEEGFRLTDEQQAQMDASLDLQTLATNYGYTDVAQFMQDYYGPYATAESYQDFIRMNMTAGFYAEALAQRLTLSDAEVEEFYDTNAATIQSNYGIMKVDQPVVNVRHILIQPESTTAADGTAAISDEAWAAAEAKAQEIYDQWLAGEATEDAFAALATEHTQDPGSQSTGGLYEDVYPGQMVPEFNDWCFAEGRQVGDHGVVKTSYGYHIMYFSGVGDQVYWRMAAEQMLRSQRALEERSKLVADFPMDSDLSKAALLDTTVQTVPQPEEAAPAEPEQPAETPAENDQPQG